MTTLLRMIAIVVFVAVAGATFAFVGLAQASTHHGYRGAEGASAHAAQSAAPASGTLSGVTDTCPWSYSWKTRKPAGGNAYGGVWWVTNPCHFRIQVRIGCTGIYENHYIPKWSGIVSAVNKFTASHCNAWVDSIDWLQRHINFGVNWYPWRNVWGKGPSSAAHGKLTVAATYPVGYIAQYRAQKMRWVSQGRGYAIWALSSGWTKFQLIFLRGGGEEFQTNANHYCVFVYRPANGTEPFLELTGHPCSGKPDQVFTVSTSGGAAQYESHETLGLVNMHGLSAGGVLVGAPGKDIYTHWITLSP